MQRLPTGAYASIICSIRRIPPPPIQVHIRFGETARLECKSSGWAVFLIPAKFGDFSRGLTIAAVWYRLMAYLYDFQRERTDKS